MHVHTFPLFRCAPSTPLGTPLLQNDRSLRLRLRLPPSSIVPNAPHPVARSFRRPCAPALRNLSSRRTSSSRWSGGSCGWAWCGLTCYGSRRRPTPNRYGYVHAPLFCLCGPVVLKGNKAGVQARRIGTLQTVRRALLGSSPESQTI